MVWRLRFRGGAVLVGVAAALVLGSAAARPLVTREGVLPPGTELFEDDTLEEPTELFVSELAGRGRSYRLNLGDILFSSPAILGGLARRAGISCNTCHREGAGNARLFVPGLSSRPGTFDTTGPSFNPKADNGRFDPVRVPSLRGARRLAPYGHDGRFGSLRAFIRHVVVDEFAGPEPSDQVLDALVTYVEDIAFLPNAKLAPDGRLTERASAAARRGEAVFRRPFPHDPSLSCAACHVPAQGFVDHRLHDVGSGGPVKTQTLRNANFNAPYFHDGRYATYAEVIAHFDRHYDLGLAEGDRADLLAYLEAVGDADKPLTRRTVRSERDALGQLARVFDKAVAEQNREVIALAVEAIGNEWRELAENFPGPKDTALKAGVAERLHAAEAVRAVVLSLRRLAMAADRGEFPAAARALADYRREVAAASGKLLRAAPFSLFDPGARKAHLRALEALTALGAPAPQKR